MITIGYITSRHFPKFDWFFDSLRKQEGIEQVGQIVVVDRFLEPANEWGADQIHARREEVYNYAGNLVSRVQHVPPKPTVWSGPYRLTKQDWWSVSNARNTWLVLADGDYCMALDDRCVLLPDWLKYGLEARDKNQAVFGAYEKHSNMVVENGVIVDPGITTATDGRESWSRDRQRVVPVKCPPEWSFGCTLGFPTAWGMEVNGWDETCDGCSAEDVFFGFYLQNCGKRYRYDYRMKMIEDRTPGQTGPVAIRRDKGVSPNDKSHAQLEMLRGLKRSMHQWDLNTVRAMVKQDGAFPLPAGPTHDWYDNQPISEMEPG